MQLHWVGLTYRSCLYLLCIFSYLFHCSFVFLGGRIPHPSLVFSLTLIYAFVVSYQKKKKKKQIGSRPKITQKVKFNPMNRMLDVFKRPTISYLPVCPKKTQRGSSPHFSPFSTHNKPLPTCKRLSNRRGKDPRHAEERKKEVPNSSCLVTMDENVINRFLLFATEETSICHSPPSLWMRSKVNTLFQVFANKETNSCLI